MAVTSQIIGKLGGGGAPETAETTVRYALRIEGYKIPSGWKKAQGVFTGTAQEVSPMMFGQWFDGLRRGTPCSGGGGRHRQHRLPGCLRHDHVGAPGVTHKAVV